MGMMDIRRRMLVNNLSLETSSGYICSFITDVAAKLKSCRMGIVPAMSGSGTPSLSNIRTISGKTYSYISHTGKSLVPFLHDSMEITQSHMNGNSGWSYDWHIPDKTTKYTYSFYVDNTNGTDVAKAKVWFKNAAGTGYVDGVVQEGNAIAAGATGWSRAVLNIPGKANTFWLMLGVDAWRGAIVSQPMVEAAEDRTTYEAFTYEDLSEDWEDDVGPVYGGYVDPANGLVVEELILISTTWGAIKSGSIDGTTGLQTGSVAFTNPVEDCTAQSAMGTDTLCNITDQIIHAGNNTLPAHYYIENNTAYISLPAADVSDDQVIQILGRLKTPTEHQISAVNTKAFKGTNCIYNDAETGVNVIVKYWKH